MRLPQARQLPSAGCVLVVLAFFVWTAWTSGALPPAHGHFSDYYNALVHGLLKGHAYLDVPVDPAMVQARDPYAPEFWRAHGLMADATYFQGHYYLYFGIVPAAVLLLPFHVLTGADLGVGAAVWIFATLAFCSLAALWKRICVRHFPDPIVLATGILLLGLNPGLLAILRRPDMYELAIASGLLFLSLAAHAFLSAMIGRRSGVWMVLAGIALGLAVGSRPPLLFAGLAAIWVIVRAPAHSRVRMFCAFSAGFGPVLAALLAYNFARFGNVLEFGFKYQLTDPPASARHYFSLRYVAYNLKTYFAAPIEWHRYFPFYELKPVMPRPAGYWLSEWVYGLAGYAPALWALPLALVAAMRRRAGRSLSPLGLLLACAAGPLLLDLVIECSALRYLGDFLPFLLLAAAFGYGTFDREADPGWLHGVARGAWTAAIFVSVAVAVIVSVPLYGAIGAHRGADFELRVARAWNFPIFWYERVRGWHYGPVTLTAQFVPGRPEEKLVETPQATVVARTRPAGELELGVSCPGTPTAWAKPVPLGDGRHVVSAAFGALFPTEAHPYYLKHAMSSANDCALALAVDGRPVLEGFRLMPAADVARIRIARGQGAGGAGWFSGAVASVARNQFTAGTAFDRSFEPWRLQFRLPQSGRRPLWSAPLNEGGDVFEVESDGKARARYGYRSRAEPRERWGPWFEGRAGEPQEIIVGADALTPSQSAVGTLRDLWIEAGGGLVWSEDVPVTGARVEDIVVAAAVTRRPAAPIPVPRQDDDTLLLRVVLPREPHLLMRDPILVWGRPGAVDAVTMIYYDTRAVRFAFDHWGLGPVVEGAIVSDADRDHPHEIRIQVRRNPGHVRIWFDGREAMNAASPVYAAPPTAAAIGVNDVHVAGESKFHGAILLARWLPGPAGPQR